MELELSKPIIGTILAIVGFGMVAWCSRFFVTAVWRKAIKPDLKPYGIVLGLALVASALCFICNAGANLFLITWLAWLVTSLIIIGSKMGWVDD